MSEAKEKGWKWWIRFVIVPIIVGLIYLITPVIQRITDDNSSYRHRNLLNYSIPVPIFIAGESNSEVNPKADKLEVIFNNMKNGSGVSLSFPKPLNVEGFRRLEIIGTSTHDFTFLVEYKHRIGGKLRIVATSPSRKYSATSLNQTVNIPITYKGDIDEISLNFFKPGESSNLVIVSIYLRNEIPKPSALETHNQS